MNDQSSPEFQLFASATYPVQLAKGIRYQPTKRVDLYASVDPETGEVRLFVDPADLKRLLAADPDD